MGHRIEPYVSIPTKLQTDSTGYNPRVSNSHWLLFPITATIESVRISVITLSREPTIKILHALIFLLFVLCLSSLQQTVDSLPLLN